MKWKVQHPDGSVVYYSPTDNQLVMIGCTFKNYRKTAQKIFDGGEKVACAWILCKDIEVYSGQWFKDESRRVRYNPRVQPNWVFDGQVMDNDGVPKLHTIDYGVYITTGEGEI